MLLWEINKGDVEFEVIKSMIYDCAFPSPFCVSFHPCSAFHTLKRSRWLSGGCVSVTKVQQTADDLVSMVTRL